MAALAVAGTVGFAVVYPLHELPGLVGALDSAAVRESRAAAGAVPHGVCVEADNNLAAHLTVTNDVTLPLASHGVASGLLVDLAHDGRATGPDPPPRDALDVAARDGFVVVGTYGSIRVLHRPGPDARRCHIASRTLPR